MQRHAAFQDRHRGEDARGRIRDGVRGIHEKDEETHPLHLLRKQRNTIICVRVQDARRTVNQKLL